MVVTIGGNIISKTQIVKNIAMYIKYCVARRMAFRQITS